MSLRAANSPHSCFDPGVRGEERGKNERRKEDKWWWVKWRHSVLTIVMRPVSVRVHVCVCVLRHCEGNRKIKITDLLEESNCFQEPTYLELSILVDVKKVRHSFIVYTWYSHLRWLINATCPLGRLRSAGVRLRAAPGPELGTLLIWGFEGQIHTMCFWTQAPLSPKLWGYFLHCEIPTQCVAAWKLGAWIGSCVLLGHEVS